jgi:hypothetical protein
VEGVAYWVKATSKRLPARCAALHNANLNLSASQVLADEVNEGFEPGASPN